MAFKKRGGDDKKYKKDGGNDNGNTVTIQKCKQAAIQSGWDNDQEQECEDLICTHPGDNAACESESEGAVVTTSVSSPSTSPTPTSNVLDMCNAIVTQDATGTIDITNTGPNTNSSQTGSGSISISQNGSASTTCTFTNTTIIVGGTARSLALD